MIPIALFIGLLLIAGLSVAGMLTKKKALFVLAMVAGIILLGFLGLLVLVNSPLWTM